MKPSVQKYRAEEGAAGQKRQSGRRVGSKAATGKKFDLNSRFLDRRLQKALLRLHAAMDTEEIIAAIFGLMEAAAPSRYIGVWFQVLDPGYEYPRILRFKPALAMTQEQLNHSLEISPARDHFAAHPGVKIWRNRDAFTDEAWRAMDFYREIAQPLGFYYTVNIGVWKGGHLLGGTSGMRSTAQGDFTDEEIKLLQRLHPFLEATIKRVDRVQAERNARVAVEQLLHRLPLPTLLLDWELRLIHSNPSGRESCARWNGGTETACLTNSRDDLIVPEPLLVACRELRSKWNSQMLNRYAVASAAGETVPHPVRGELRANIHLVQRSVGSITKPIFRIEFQPLPGGGNPAADRDLAVAARLTRRERELVELLCQGDANKEIASRLNLSIGTVKKELNTLYQKLEVQSRTQLMALMR